MINLLLYLTSINNSYTDLHASILCNSSFNFTIFIFTYFLTFGCTRSYLGEYIGNASGVLNSSFLGEYLQNDVSPVTRLFLEQINGNYKQLNLSSLALTKLSKTNRRQLYLFKSINPELFQPVFIYNGVYEPHLGLAFLAFKLLYAQSYIVELLFYSVDPSCIVNSDFKLFLIECFILSLLYQSCLSFVKHD